MTVVNMQVQFSDEGESGITNTRKLGIWRGARLEYDVETCPEWGDFVAIHVNSMTDWWSERHIFNKEPAKKKGRSKKRP